MARCSSSEIIMCCLFGDITVYYPHMFGRGYSINGHFSLLKFHFIPVALRKNIVVKCQSIRMNDNVIIHTYGRGT